MDDRNPLFKNTSWVNPTPKKKPLQASWNVIDTHTLPPNKPNKDIQLGRQTYDLKDASYKWLLAKKLSNFF